MFYYLTPIDFIDAITISELYELCQKYNVEAAKITVYDNTIEDYSLVSKKYIYYQTFGLIQENNDFKTLKYFCFTNDTSLVDVYDEYTTASKPIVAGISVKELYNFAKDNNMLDYHIIIENDTHPWILNRELVKDQVIATSKREESDHFILCFSESSKTDLLDSINSEMDEIRKMVI